MARIVVRGVPPHDGEYEFEVDRSFTTRELRWVKQIANYLPANLQEGLDGGDADLVIAIVVISMFRAGKIGRDEVLSVADRLSDEPIDDEAFLTIIAEDDDEESDELPPPSPLEPGASSRSSSDEKPSGFGSLSSTDTDPPAAILSDTGT